MNGYLCEGSFCDQAADWEIDYVRVEAAEEHHGYAFACQQHLPELIPTDQGVGVITLTRLWKGEEVPA